MSGGCATTTPTWRGRSSICGRRSSGGVRRSSTRCSPSRSSRRSLRTRAGRARPGAQPPLPPNPRRARWKGLSFCALHGHNGHPSPPSMWQLDRQHRALPARVVRDGLLHDAQRTREPPGVSRAARISHPASGQQRLARGEAQAEHVLRRARPDPGRGARARAAGAPSRATPTSLFLRAAGPGTAPPHPRITTLRRARRLRIPT
eukprot:2363142-Prymnesium_polylepis.1